MNIRELLETNFPVQGRHASGLEGYGDPLTLSEESFVSAVTNFFGDIRRNWVEGRRPQDWRDNVSKAREVMSVYYTNADWLARRRFVEGDVKIGELTPYIVVNNKIATPEEALEGLQAFRNAFELYVAALRDYYPKLRRVADRVMRAEINDENLREFSSDLKSLVDPETRIEAELERRFSVPLGNLRFSNGSVTKPMRSIVRKVPALDQDGVIQSATVVLDYLDVIDHYWDIISDMGNAGALSFAKDPNWHGWTKINEYRYGKGGIAKRIPDTVSPHVPASENPWINLGTKVLGDIGVSVLKDSLTDQARADAWTSLVNNFRGRQPSLSRKFNGAMYNIIRAYAEWIDASVR